MESFVPRVETANYLGGTQRFNGYEKAAGGRSLAVFEKDNRLITKVKTSGWLASQHLFASRVTYSYTRRFPSIRFA